MNMKREIAFLALIAAMIGPAWARAEVTTGTAAKVPAYQTRGATEIADAGSLAPELQGKPYAPEQPAP
jgi:hypothetical protein